MSFNPKRSPLKEGRSHPGLPYGGSAQGPKSRQGMIIILALICIPAFIFFLSGGLNPTTAATSSSRLQSVLDKSKTTGASEPRVVVNGAQHRGQDQPVGIDTPDDPQAAFKAPAATQSLTVTTGATAGLSESAKPKKPSWAQDDVASPARKVDEEPASPRGYSGSQTSPLPGAGYGSSSSLPPSSKVDATGTEVWEERPKFEKALAKVINMLPGEMHMRDLLRQVEGTGKEKLREMGLRVRAYKSYFDAWEELHLDFDAEGGSYVRDDVVQYLRSHEHAGLSEGIAGLTDMSLAQQVRSYESYRYFLAKFGQLLFPYTAPYFADHMTLHAHFKRGGKGIVLTAGDDQAAYLLTSIPIMRQLGCTLPIEVMYLGDSDLSEDFRSDLEALDGVMTRDIAQMVNDEGWRLAGWAAKPFAILFSSFREVIFIDADSLFFRDPATLFDQPQYKSTGALFFRDRLIMPENKKRWLQQILPKPISKQVKQSRFWTGDSGHMQESGVVVVDKWRHYMALLLVTRMNGPDRDGNKDEGRIGVYDMVYGDKETFWIGWELVGDLDYAFHAGDAGIMGEVGQHQKKGEDEHHDEEKPKKKKKPQKPEGEETPEGEDQSGQEDGEEVEDEEPAVRPEVTQTPENYTICAPQLLHLDVEGKPFWFNGWLLDNKFADKKQKKFGKFDHYLLEPHDLREPGAWQLEESNMCCLTTDLDKKFDFSQAEKQLLADMMKKAREVGAPGSG